MYKVSLDRFEKVVADAIEGIPEQFQEYLANIQFVVETRSEEGLMGLYEGATALETGDGLPERIVIYKESHEAATKTWDGLVEEVRRTILHEVGHHFGMEEDELPY